MRSSRRHAIKNNSRESEQFRRRSALALIAVALAIFGLIVGYFRLQVLQHDEYDTRSDQNRIRVKPVLPNRGVIFDRNGKLIAENAMAFRLDLIPEQVENLPELLDTLSSVITIDQDELSKLSASVKRKLRKFEPLTIRQRLTEPEIAALAVNRYRLTGVEVVPYQSRHYPYGALLAHAIGYVGRPDEQDMAKLEALQLTALTQIGKSGAERYYDELLRGEVGHQEIETDVENRPVRVLRQTEAIAGTNIYLSVDLDLQREAVQAFAGQPGAALAMDPRTGEILAMVSLPSFDSNLFVEGIRTVDFAALNADPGRPLFNRTVLGGFAPGSTIKPFMALAGLDYGLIRPDSKVLSTGAYRLPNQSREYRDWKEGGHGLVNLRDSLAQSVNTYYYQLAVDLGQDRIAEYLAKFGFGKRTGIDLNGESTGILPSREWKRERFNQTWFPGETVISGIGQGFWVTTPLQLIVAYSAMANGGMIVQPRIFRAKQSNLAEGLQLADTPPVRKIELPEKYVDEVNAGLVAVMHSEKGTARAAALGMTYQIAGKTGTAQRVSRQGDEKIELDKLPYHLRHQALFVGYAPADNPQIAIVVVVEHGGSGSTSAAPIARKIFDAYLVNEQGELRESQVQRPLKALQESAR